VEPRVRSLPRVLIDPERIRDGVVEVDGAEARHARVRRLARGEAVVVFDGRGRSWLGRVSAWSARGPTVAIERALPERDGESSLALTLAIALLKADKLEWVIEKATELGAVRIRPFSCARSLAHPSARRVARWRQIALSAAKQCGRSVVPAVDDPADLSVILAEPIECGLLLWEGAARGDVLPSAAPAPTAASVLIGPEGGFTVEEVAAARAAGYRVGSLGLRILRAETAAIAAVALCQRRWGDL
jgi:16S rRNA (uracil1498-N3)-methyltransferase